MSFSDFGLNYTYINCPSLETVPEFWAKGQPDNKGGNEPFLGFQFCADCPDFGYGDFDSFKKFPALCEVGHKNLNKLKARLQYYLN